MDESTFTATQIETGRKLFAGPCAFMTGVVAMDQLPPAALPEVAFAGRSNVGKSSLINALTGRNGLARASNTPGRTQQLNFFDLGDRLMLVDLPGYGYAKAPKEEVAQWAGLTRDYLRGRPNLQRVFLLIDARRGVGKTDEEVMEMLDSAAVIYQLVLTKADKVKPPAIKRLVAESEAIVKKHGAAFPIVLATSAEKNAGLAELRAAIAGFADA